MPTAARKLKLTIAAKRKTKINLAEGSSKLFHCAVAIVGQVEDAEEEGVKEGGAAEAEVVGESDRVG